MSTSNSSGQAIHSYQQHTAPSTPSSSGGPALTYAYPGTLSTPGSATSNTAYSSNPGSAIGVGIGVGVGIGASAGQGIGMNQGGSNSRMGSAAPSAANSPFMSAMPMPGPSPVAAPGSTAGQMFPPQQQQGGMNIQGQGQGQMERMVQSGRNTPVQRASPSPAPHTAGPAGGGMGGQMPGGGQAQSMGRSVSMMDMNQWARISAQQSFMQQQQQQQQQNAMGQWGMGMDVPSISGVQESPTGIPRPASSSPTSNPHSGFHPSSFGPTPMQLGLNPAHFPSGSMASGNTSYSGIGMDPGMSMSISPPNWNWSMPGQGGVGSYGANGYIGGGNGSFVGSYGGNMMGTSFGRERDRELEARWGREFVCCGANFGGMHQLLEHYEEEHAKLTPDARMAALNAANAPGQGAGGPSTGFNLVNQAAQNQAQAQSSQGMSQGHGDVPTPPGMMDIEMEDAPPPPPMSAPPGSTGPGGNMRMMPGMGAGVAANRQLQGSSTGGSTPLSAGSGVGRASPLQQQHQPQLPQMGSFPPPPAPGPPISSASALAMHPALAGQLPMGHPHAHGLMSAPVIGQQMGGPNMAQQSPWAAAFRPQPTFVGGIQPSLLNMPGMGPIPGAPQQGQGSGQVQGGQQGLPMGMGIPNAATIQALAQRNANARSATNPAGLSISTNFGLPSGSGIPYSQSAPQTPVPSGPSRAGTPSGSGRTLTKEELDARAAKRAQKKAAAAAAAISGGLHSGEGDDSDDHGKGEDKRFPCPIEGCGKVYKQQNGLRYHLTKSINSGHGNLQILGSLGYLIGEGKDGKGP